MPIHANPIRFSVPKSGTVHLQQPSEITRKVDAFNAEDVFVGRFEPDRVRALLASGQATPNRNRKGFIVSIRLGGAH